jgi:eukaryotic-like serine/threonine-protein kinase
MLARGTVVDRRFEIELEAGSGGFGTVYRALDRQSGQPVALKVLHEARGEAVDAARFSREAQLLAELDHPNIVAYVGEGVTEEGRSFLVMEWLEGETLASRLDHEPLTLGDALFVVRGAASGLAEAHRRGIVHRDLKPSNLLLRDGSVERVMLLDLGIARRAGLSLTRSGQVMGTPRYMSPEQGWGREVGPAADVFALGCVAFECLTGVPAFAAEHPAAALAKVLFEGAPRLASVRADVPEPVAALVDRMLAREPAERLPDGAAVVTALAALPAALEGPAPGARTAPAVFGRDELRLASVVIAEVSSTVDSWLHRELSARASYVELSAGGRAIVATFLHEGPSAVDQAANAVAAARFVLERSSRSKVAVVTGRVRDKERSEGELVARGSALMAALPGAVSLDDITVSLLEGRLRTVVRDGVPIADDEVVLDESRLLLGQPTPCVGREQELSTLEHVFDACVDESSARAVLVTADAGAGKSRIRHELLRRLAAAGKEPLVLSGRADATRQGASFGVLAHALRELFGGADRGAQEERIRARVGRHFTGDEAERVAEFLGELAGVPFAESPRLASARVDTRGMRAQVAGAWVDLLRAECALRPVLLLLEDLHWSDAASLDLVEVALREVVEVPLMVVGFARPELVERRPALWRGRAQELPLQPLGKRACGRLAREVLGAAMSDAEVDRLVEQSAGNALFLEELIRAAHEGKSAHAPATVLAMLQARIGRLEAPLRRVLRAASLFGETFVSAGVLEIHGSAASERDLERWLSLLVREEIVELRRGERALGAPPYRFRHALMREAAYALLTDEDRIVGHRAAAAFLAARGGEPAAVAEHFALAGDTETAATHLETAAAQAYDRGDLETAGHLAKRGLALGATGAARGTMLAVEANLLVRTWDWHTGLQAGEEALRLLAPGSAWWSRAVTAIICFYAYRNDRAAALALAEGFLRSEPSASARLHYVDAVAHVASAMTHIGFTSIGRRGLARIAEVAPDLARYPGVNAFVTLIRCTLLRHTTDDMAAQLRAARTSVAIYAEAGGDPLVAILAQDTLGEVLFRAGQNEEAEVGLRGALATARAISHVYAQSHVSLAFAHGLLVSEQPESDLEAESLALAVLETKGISAGYEAMARHILAQVLARRGERTRAVAEAERAIALSEHTPVRRLQMIATRAALFASPEEARATVETALALLEQIGGEGGYAEAGALLVAADVLFACGEPARAAETLARARRGLLGRAAGFDEPARERFLANVPLHARIVARAAALLD